MVRFVNFRLSELDLQVLKDIVRFGWMATDQIARRYGFGRTICPPQLRRLERLCLVKRDDDWPPRLGGIWVATDVGAHYAAVGLAAVSVDRRYLFHHLTVTDLADYLLRVVSGACWVSERELTQIAQQRARRGFRSLERHRPDGLLRTHGLCIAIEVELSEKSDFDYGKILTWYAEQPDIDRLRWYTDLPGLRPRLERLIDSHGYAHEFDMSIHEFPPGVEKRR